MTTFVPLHRLLFSNSMLGQLVLVKIRLRAVRWAVFDALRLSRWNWL